MVGELDAGNPHVQFDEGALETCDSVTRLRPTLPQPLVMARSTRLYSFETLLTSGVLTHILAPSKAMPKPPEGIGNVPRLRPSSARISVTVLWSLLTTQMLEPSNATATQ